MQYIKQKYITGFVVSLLMVSTVYAEDRHSLSAKQTQLMHDIGYGVLTARATKSEKIKAENQSFYDEIKSLRESADSWERAELQLIQPDAGSPTLNQSPDAAQSRQNKREQKQLVRDGERQKVVSAVNKLRESRKQHVSEQEQVDDPVLKKLDELQKTVEEIQLAEDKDKVEKLAHFRSELNGNSQLGGERDPINPANMKPTFRIDTTKNTNKKINKNFVVGENK